MSQTPDRVSDSGSDYGWPMDLHLEQIHQEQVLFENIAEEYVKGDDITIFFTIVNDGKINPDADRIGLTRIGCTDMKQCLLYAPVQITPATGAGAVRHGTATFASTTLPDVENEFYQFCYINEAKKNLGSSLPFQLNCTSTDADLLSNGKISKGDRLITMGDQDEADMLVISTQRILTEEKLRKENRQLLEIKRRLEAENEELSTKFDALQMKDQRVNDNEEEYQKLLASHRNALDELEARKQTQEKILEEFEKIRLLSEEYHRDALQYAERCRTLEDAQTKLGQEATQTRSQLAVTSQLVKDQATQIIDLEHRLMQSSEIMKTTNQRLTTAEQQARDQKLTAEKRLLSLEGENQHLKNENQRLIEENHELIMKIENQRETVEQSRRQLERSDGDYSAAVNQIKELQKQIDEARAEQGTTATLKTTLAALEQRCVKYRSGEVEARKFATEQKKIIEELQGDNKDLRARLQDAEEQYKALYRKYAQVQQGNNVSVELAKNNNNTAAVRKEPEGDELLEMLEGPKTNKVPEKPNEPEFYDAPRHQTTNHEEKELDSCPICYFEFPRHMKLEDKQTHVDHHFD